MTKTIVDKALGTIVLTKSNRAKRLIIRLKPDCISVTLPTRATYEEALKFLESKRDWVLANKENARIKRRTICNDEPFVALTFSVKLQPANRKDYFISLKNKLLTIEYPEHISPESEKAQQVFRKAIENAMRHEAKRVLPQMLATLAGEHGFSFSEVKITSGKGRWGSCSSRTTINLSLYLMLLPEHLVHYVLLHELCHTKEMNHGVRFWQWLDKVTDNRAKALAKEIKKYSISDIAV